MRHPRYMKGKNTQGTIITDVVSMLKKEVNNIYMKKKPTSIPPLRIIVGHTKESSDFLLSFKFI